jgi:hypothetical protein
MCSSQGLLLSHFLSCYSLILIQQNYQYNDFGLKSQEEFIG